MRHINDRGVPPPLFAPCLLLAGYAKLNPFFHHLDAVFFLRLREHVYYL